MLEQRSVFSIITDCLGHLSMMVPINFQDKPPTAIAYQKIHLYTSIHLILAQQSIFESNAPPSIGEKEDAALVQSDRDFAFHFGA
jgi:hypothetical protein